MIEECCLPNPGLSMNNDRAALSVPGHRQQGFERLALVGPTKQAF
jgi:hypothetical protein